MVDVFLRPIEQPPRLFREKLGTRSGNGSEKRGNARAEQLDIVRESTGRGAAPIAREPGGQQLLQSQESAVEGQQWVKSFITIRELLSALDASIP